MYLHHKILGKGQPLIILHGLFGSSDNFFSLSQKISQYFEVHLLDLRNHGLSFHSAEMNYQNMASDVATYIEQKVLVPAFILGHSMGGKVAMELALSQPEIVKAIVVIDIAPVCYKPSHKDIIDALLHLSDCQVKNRTEADAFLSQFISDSAVRKFLLKNVEFKSGALHLKVNIVAIAKHYKQLCAGLDLDRHYANPALFIKGSRSDYINQERAQSIKKCFSVASFAELCAGHWVHAEQPDELFKCVVDFLT